MPSVPTLLAPNRMSNFGRPCTVELVAGEQPAGRVALIAWTTALSPAFWALERLLRNDKFASTNKNAPD